MRREPSLARTEKRKGEKGKGREGEAVEVGGELDSAKGGGRRELVVLVVKSLCF